MGGRSGNDRGGNLLCCGCGEARPGPGSCWLRRAGRHRDSRRLGCRGGGGGRGSLGLLWLSSLFGDRSLSGLGSLLTDCGRRLFGLRGLDLLGSNWLSSWLFLCCLKLLINLGQVLLTVCNLAAVVERCILRDSRGRGRLLYAVCGLLLKVLLLLWLLSKVAEDIIENEVAVGLLGEDEGLGETPVGLALVGDLTNDLDDDVRLGALSVNVGDANLGVLEVEKLDALTDGLLLSATITTVAASSAYLSSYANVDLLLFNAGNVLRAPVVEKLYLVSSLPLSPQVEAATHVETLRALAEGCVVLLDKVPADLVLGHLGSRRLLCGLGGGLLRGGEVGSAGRIAVLVPLGRVAAVDVGG